ncbi:phage neck terminator protein [Archaeoglobus profundus]|uniref:Phage neck terminator protein gp12-like domain-containing protein n=1 Tax=Archaeoglobus profundus (strain DSM 5631 / JCM 9629 / NBRC 100127 / Av18) TaxID=572546 RepID=D2REJ7_ARCPA|nr:hypothetical protein [Archaeoglobus profundus]ADB58541.1 hypothetical protein Arcpr_1494 [Archaeoglobus profundus DSM 5631]
MLEALIWDELYGKIPKSFEYEGQAVTIEVYRANQVFQKEKPRFPFVVINFLEPVIDRTNTPLNEILKIGLNLDGDIEYTKGVVIRQSFDLNVYDNDVRRIAQLQNYLWLWAKKDLTLTDVTVFEVLPPRNLDFVEDYYIYRRVIEVVCKFAVSWEEIVKTIEEVETTVETQS